MPVTHQCERDATGERSVSLAKMVLYYNTHLAVILIPSFFLPPLAGHLALRGLHSSLRMTWHLDSRDKV